MTKTITTKTKKKKRNKMNLIKTNTTKITTSSLRDMMKPLTGSACLLLDTSGSMSSHTNDGRRMIDALRDLVQEFPSTRQFAFDSTVEEIPAGERIPEPRGNTDMAKAFAYLKANDLTHAILITDGQPNNEAAALHEAQGLRLDIFYVGPKPEPPFLRQLAQATGGQYGATSLTKEGSNKIADGIKGLLGSAQDERKEPIAL